MQNNGLEQFDRIDLSEPTKCEKCGSVHIKYNGIGEYECEECRLKMYDDYGKVRNYLEQHPGATATEVSEMVGVTKQKIRRLLKDDKIQIAPGSATFIYCEKCGTGILSGRFCASCIAEMGNSVNANTKSQRGSNITGGFGMGTKGQSGAKRFEKK